jgi:uncharacterized protein (TIGR02271 family)
MTVRTTDGEKLGKIISCQQSEFIIEKGFFFPKDYVLRFEDIAELRDGEVLLRHSAAQLRELGQTSAFAASDAAQSSATSTTASGASDQVKVPVVEEELTAEKRMKEAGQVRLHKDVTTEHKQITVPVMKEEVHVERVPAGADARAGDTSFQKGTVTVPVREEEVDIRKRPVVREEVRVSKTPQQVERRADAEIRKESVEVEKEGEIDPTGKGIGEPE